MQCSISKNIKHYFCIMRKLLNQELQRKTKEEIAISKKTPLIIILDDVRSLHNIGSVFRTSDAFLIEKIYLCGITATPPNKEINKTALGATDTVAWEYTKDVLEVIKKLKEEKIKIFSVEQTENAIMLNNFQVNTNEHYALIFGNEVKGVAQEAIDICNGVIEIPQIGSKHSLNISVSVGVVVWHFFNKLNV